MLPTRAPADAKITIMAFADSEDFDSKESNHEPETYLVGNHQEQLLPQSDDENQEARCLPSPRAHHILQQAEQRCSMYSTFLPSKSIASLNYCYPTRCIGNNCPLWTLHLRSSNSCFPICQSEPGLLDNLPAMFIALDHDWIMLPLVALGSCHVELVAGKLRHSWNMCAFAHIIVCTCFNQK